ncbi:cytochrome c peroxidase [Phlyctema vagabunda]|uniref:Peroxidase n=1 Tax=Phlyctema vagabunda TaxID=108571 RepID=A0ABR4P3I2_9HELO
MASSARTFARAAIRSTPSTSAIKTTSRNGAFALPRQAFRQQSRRGYSSQQPTKSSSSGLFIGAGALALGGAAYYLYSGGNGSLLSGSASETSGIFTPKPEDYQKVYNEIAARLEEKDDYDDGSYGPVLVRLAWHASGTYDKETGTGGSNGATMRFAPEGDHGANAGLIAARDFMEPIKQKFPWITYSDLWILGGVVAIQEMQGPTIPYRPGRKDKDIAACTPDGRLPDASKEQKHLRAIFNRMGFNDQEIVALSGAHALGRCHTDRSGFSGPWTFSPTVVTNDYYKLLLDEKWQWKKWNGPKQLEDKTTKSLMMLPTDIALVNDKSFKSFVEKYAKDEQLFFKDFSNVIVKLFELGVPFDETTQQERMILKPTA